MTKNKPQSISWQANGAAMSDNGALRLAAKRHESAEPVNLTWTEYS